MINFSKNTAVNQFFYFSESANEFIVIAHLGNKIFLGCQFYQFFSFRYSQAEWFFCKNMNVFFKQIFNNSIMKFSGDSYKNSIRLNLVYHFFVICKTIKIAILC